MLVYLAQPVVAIRPMLNVAISNRKPVSMAFVTTLPFRPKQLDANKTDCAAVPISPILRLPPHLRRRIYLHADLLVRYDLPGLKDTHAVLNLNGGTPVPYLLCRPTCEKHGLNGILTSTAYSFLVGPSTKKHPPCFTATTDLSFGTRRRNH